MIKIECKSMDFSTPKHDFRFQNQKKTWCSVCVKTVLHKVMWKVVLLVNVLFYTTPRLVQVQSAAALLVMFLLSLLESNIFCADE